MQKPTHGYNPNPVVLPEAAKRAAEEEARARQTQVEVVATEGEAMQMERHCVLALCRLSLKAPRTHDSSRLARVGRIDALGHLRIQPAS